MSLRHAVLGMLSVTSCTGYELTQWFDSSLQHAWHASHSQIYPELAKLEAEGLAEVVGGGRAPLEDLRGDRRRPEELRRWLMETEPNRAQRNETALRWFLVFRLEPERAPGRARARARVRRGRGGRARRGWPRSSTPRARPAAFAPCSTSPPASTRR